MKNHVTLQQRVDFLEREINLLKSHLFKNSQKPWWQNIVDVFENDPDFEQISSMGQGIREQERMEAQT